MNLFFHIKKRKDRRGSNHGIAQDFIDHIFKVYEIIVIHNLSAESILVMHIEP